MLLGRCRDVVGTLPERCRDAVGALCGPERYRNVVGELSGRCRSVGGTSSGRCRGVVGTLSERCRNAVGASPGCCQNVGGAFFPVRCRSVAGALLGRCLGVVGWRYGRISLNTPKDLYGPKFGYFQPWCALLRRDVIINWAIWSSTSTPRRPSGKGERVMETPRLQCETRWKHQPERGLFTFTNPHTYNHICLQACNITPVRSYNITSSQTKKSIHLQSYNVTSLQHIHNSNNSELTSLQTYKLTNLSKQLQTYKHTNLRTL